MPVSPLKDRDGLEIRKGVNMELKWLFTQKGKGDSTLLFRVQINIFLDEYIF